MNSTNTISNEVKSQIIGEYIKTAAGRAKLAASMIGMQSALSLRRILAITNAGQSTAVSSYTRRKLDAMLLSAESQAKGLKLNEITHSAVSLSDVARGNVPIFMTRQLNRVLTTKNYSRMAFMKPLIDPYNQMTADVYATWVANSVRRYESTLYKTLGLNGPFGHLNAPGSTVEPVSQADTEFEEIKGIILGAIAKFNENRALPEDYNKPSASLLELVGGTSRFVDTSSNSKTVLAQLRKERSNGGEKLLIIPAHTRPSGAATSPTDSSAMKISRDLGFGSVILFTLEELDTAPIPDGYAANQKFIVFNTEKDRNEFMRNMPKRTPIYVS